MNESTWEWDWHPHPPDPESTIRPSRICPGCHGHAGKTATGNWYILYPRQPDCPPDLWHLTQQQLDQLTGRDTTT